MYDYDLLVIGSGPGGQKAAIGAANRNPDPAGNTIELQQDTNR